MLACLLPASLKLTVRPMKIGLPNRKVVFQPSIFRCKLAVGFREGKSFTFITSLEPMIPGLQRSSHCNKDLAKVQQTHRTGFKKEQRRVMARDSDVLFC